MHQQAIDFLRELQELLSKRPDYAQNRNPSFESECDKHLIEFEPYQALKGAHVVSGSGGDLPGEELSGWWSISRLLEGLPPEEVVARAEREIAENKVIVSEIVNVKGIKVVEAVQLADDAWLCPNADVPRGPWTDRVFSDEIGGTRVRNENAALVCRYSVAPALFRHGEADAYKQSQESHLAAARARDTFRSNVRRALILEGPGPVEMPSWYAASEGDQLLAPPSGLIFTLDDFYVPRPREVPRSATVITYLRLLQNFSKPEVLNLAIDRLARARLGRDQVSRAIELGISMEAALMAGDRNSNQEISNKIGTRAGWLLGANLEERRRAKRRAGWLYSARSDAAHLGKIEDKTLKTYTFEESNAFVQSVLVAVLERGGFPDWTDLTFGADGEEATGAEPG